MKIVNYRIREIMSVNLLPLLESKLFEEVKARGSGRKTITSNVITLQGIVYAKVYYKSFK